MDQIVRYRQLLGYRSERFAPQANDFEQLQSLFQNAILESVRDFITRLSDCVLYYRFDATTKMGKIKTYSHFVTTNVGPELPSYHPFPISLIGHTLRFRSLGMGNEYLPLMLDSGKTSWLFCALNPAGGPICVHKDELSFGEGDQKQWTTIAPSFEEFIAGLQLDLRPLLGAFRIAGTSNVNSSMRDWLTAALGVDWESQVASRRKKPR